MSNDLRIWKYNKHQIRTVTKDGEPWFVAKDICDTLNLANTSQATSKLEDAEKGIIRMDTLGGEQSMVIVNESGMYAMILRSDKAEARTFRVWVTGTVLPAIRKHGAYTIATATPALAVPTTFSEALFLAAKQAEQIEQWLAHQTSRTSEASSYTATFFTARRR